jgi:hypothetical protein
LSNQNKKPDPAKRSGGGKGGKSGGGGPTAMYTLGYAAPSRPGWCLLFSASVADVDPAAPGGGAFGAMTRLLPRWALHLFTQEVLDGDLALLHFQERNLAEVRGARDGRRVVVFSRAPVCFFKSAGARGASGGCEIHQLTNPTKHHHQN